VIALTALPMAASRDSVDITLDLNVIALTALPMAASRDSVDITLDLSVIALTAPTMAASRDSVDIITLDSSVIALTAPPMAASRDSVDITLDSSVIALTAPPMTASRLGRYHTRFERDCTHSTADDGKLTQLISLDLSMTFDMVDSLPLTFTWPYLRYDVVWRKRNINRTVSVLQYCVLL